MEGRAKKSADRGAVRDPDVWRQLRDEFQTLADKQRKLVREVGKGDLRLRACWAQDSDVVVEASAILQPNPWRYKWGSGSWQIGKGSDEDLRARFDALATRAGIALNPRRDASPRDFWLHNLYLHLEKSDSRSFSKGNNSIFIEDLFQSSVTFCSSLEVDALVAQSGSPGKAEKNLGGQSGRLVGQNINQLRTDCGWSLDMLARKTGIDKKLILNHVNKGAKPHPSTLKDYAQAFSKELGRVISASDLERPLRPTGQSQKTTG